MPADRLDRDLLQRQLRAVNITLYECHPVGGGFALLLATARNAWWPSRYEATRQLLTFPPG